MNFKTGRDLNGIGSDLPIFSPMFGEGSGQDGAAIKFAIFPGSVLRKAQPKWVMAAELAETTRLYARCVAKIEPEWVEGVAGHLVKRHYFDPHWDAKRGMFSDVNPKTGKRTRVKAAVCFYPYFTDLADASHLDGLRAALFDPAQFWTPFPVPSSSVDDPLFSADAEWKGKRHACPWNGRTWPMTNSHLVEALAAASRLGAPDLRARTAELLKRFVRMMFHEGDLRRPNCYEHYNPLTGRAAIYRGIDDYQHSWVADLILRYAAGVQPHEGGITVDPFPLGLEQLTLTGVRVRGRAIEVRIVGDKFTVISGGDRTESAVGDAVELSF